MTWIWSLVWHFAGQYLKGQVILRAKRQGVMAYMRALEGTRRTLILAVLGFFVMQMMVLAGIGALVTGLWLLDLELRATIRILFVVFSVLFLLPLSALAVALSGRTWYRFSGAEKLVEKLRAESGKN